MSNYCFSASKFDNINITVNLTHHKSIMCHVEKRCDVGLLCFDLTDPVMGVQVIDIDETFITTYCQSLTLCSESHLVYR